MIMDLFLDTLRKRLHLTECPPNIIVPLENIDFKLQEDEREFRATEYVFTTSFNEHCYVVYDKLTGKHMQPLHLSHGRKTFIQAGVEV